MKHIILIGVLAYLLCTIIGCDKSADCDIDSQLVGTWIRQYAGDSASETIISTYTFQADGTGVIGPGVERPFTWCVVDEMLQIQHELGNHISKSTYLVNGSEFMPHALVRQSGTGNTGKWHSKYQFDEGVSDYWYETSRTFTIEGTSFERIFERDGDDHDARGVSSGDIAFDDNLFTLDISYIQEPDYLYEDYDPVAPGEEFFGCLLMDTRGMIVVPSSEPIDCNNETYKKQ